MGLPVSHGVRAIQFDMVFPSYNAFMLQFPADDMNLATTDMAIFNINLDVALIIYDIDVHVYEPDRIE